MKTPSFKGRFQLYSRQLPTLPQGCPSSTISASGLNFSVRNGKRCFPAAIVTGNFFTEFTAPARVCTRGAFTGNGIRVLMTLDEICRRAEDLINNRPSQSDY